ncbi:MAG: hypothetical protein HY724_12040, partial [Candidatus Rokubacteria bacterium]|nr:hypothetical protein [Candidatus Rokubacteria bacterium]
AMEPVHALTVTEASARIRRGELSAVSLVEALLARTDALDASVKAWVAVDRTGALETAGQRDREALAGRLRGPLHGVPVGLKDIYHVAGMTTTAGAGAFAHERPAEDAESVRRLRQAGAIGLGKTASTGDPTFCAPWSFAGLPAISLRSGLAQDGLPLAIQLVSRLFDEARLLAVARWAEAALAFSSAPPQAELTGA